MVAIRKTPNAAECFSIGSETSDVPRMAWMARYIDSVAAAAVMAKPMNHPCAKCITRSVVM